MSPPEVSMVVPLYNEETTAFRVVSELISELRGGDTALELVLVENGSLDRTGAEIRRVQDLNSEVRHVRVEKNEGYGWGVLQGLSKAAGRTVGFMGGDGQISARDARRIWEVARANPGSLVKARRIRRFDGMVRFFTSAVFNFLMRVCFGKISRDVNGTPKLFPREWLPDLQLTSKDWFLDAEVLLKASALRKNVIEVDVSFGKREGGRSHVRWAAVLEFFRNIARYRWGRERTVWKRGVRA